MSPADNFLQKQQKQRERRVKKGPRWQSTPRAAQIAQPMDSRRGERGENMTLCR